MKRVKRLVTAVTSTASLVRGILRALRKGGRKQEQPPAWSPPEPAPAASEEAEPEFAPEPEPEVEPAAEPEAAVEPEVASESAPDEGAEEDEPVESDLVVKGVVIYAPEKLVAWVNEATEDDLREAGVKGRALSVLQEARPFADAEALGHTNGVGRRTLQALCTAAEA